MTGMKILFCHLPSLLFHINNHLDVLYHLSFLRILPPFPYHLPPIAQLPSNPELPPPSLVPQCDPTASNTQTEDSFKLSKVQLDSLRSRSVSRGNFAKNLLTTILPQDKWKTHNVRGKRGKQAIDASLIDYVKECTFDAFQKMLAKTL